MNLICAGVVLYNPDIDRLRKNLESIINQVSIVLLQDNGSSNIKEIEELIKPWQNVKLINNPVNKGIAWALNNLCRCALEDQYEWILTLDQDSICPENMIFDFSKYLKNADMLCPKIVDKNYGLIDGGNAKIEPVKECITSGCLLKLASWEKIHGFDETMFIDGVDFEFCYRMNQAGMKIYRVNDIVLNHEIGNITVRHFLGFKVIVKNHSAFRKYYIARNTIYFARKNKQTMIKANLQVIKQVLIVILYEKRKLKKISKILKGIKDGYQMKIDKHSLNIEGEKC